MKRVFWWTSTGGKGIPTHTVAHLVTPCPDPETLAQRHFKGVLGEMQGQVRDDLKGFFKSGFSSLRGLRVSTLRAFEITSACVVLHSIATIWEKKRALHVPPDILDPTTLDYLTGTASRQAITEQFYATNKTNHRIRFTCLLKMSAFAGEKRRKQKL